MGSRVAVNGPLIAFRVDGINVTAVDSDDMQKLFRQGFSSMPEVRGKRSTKRRLDDDIDRSV